MNWEAIIAVSEIIGVIAIVVTLLLVIKEIRQNSQVLGITALRDATEQWNHWSNMVASSPDLADIVVRGDRSYTTLSAPDAIRYGAYLQTFFDNASSYRTMVLDHRVEDDLDVLDAIVRRRVFKTGYVEWWDENKSDYGNGFIAWVDEILANSHSGANHE